MSEQAVIDAPKKVKHEKKKDDDVEYGIEREEVINFLRCDFTDSERMEIAKSLTMQMYERESKQEEFDSIKKQYNGELSTLENEIKGKQRLVHDGYEFRPTPCQIERDYNTKTFTATRLDTGEIIEQRSLRPGEMQRKLFKDQAEKEKAEAVNA